MIQTKFYYQQAQVEFEMSEEEITNALDELKESVTKMVKFKKAFAKDTKKGVGLHNYRIFQDTYLNL